MRRGIVTLALVVAAVLMGFFGSPHCLGMCGGLISAFGMSMQDLTAKKRRALVATYHLGRLLSYATLGLIAGLVGTTVLAPLIADNNLPRILLGLVLVFVGMVMLGAPFLNKLERLGMKFWQKLAPIRQKVFPLNTYPRALSAGLLWGFLPCGLVYGALLIAVVGHSPLSGAMLMFAFGLGTLPMLIATHETVGWLRNQIGRLKLRQMNGAIMMLSGVAVIAVPIAMSNMHGGHGSHGMDMGSTMNHEMSHDMSSHSNHDANAMEMPEDHSPSSDHQGMSHH
nr:sulfite exporter TauE/SafE family protein [Psychrobacter ciconiae]